MKVSTRVGFLGFRMMAKDLRLGYHNTERTYRFRLPYYDFLRQVLTNVGSWGVKVTLQPQALEPYENYEDPPGFLLRN